MNTCSVSAASNVSVKHRFFASTDRLIPSTLHNKCRYLIRIIQHNTIHLLSDMHMSLSVCVKQPRLTVCSFCFAASLLNVISTVMVATWISNSSKTSLISWQILTFSRPDLMFCFICFTREGCMCSLGPWSSPCRGRAVSLYQGLGL